MKDPRGGVLELIPPCPCLLGTQWPRLFPPAPRGKAEDRGCSHFWGESRIGSPRTASCVEAVLGVSGLFAWRWEVILEVLWPRVGRFPQGRATESPTIYSRRVDVGVTCGSRLSGDSPRSRATEQVFSAVLKQPLRGIDNDAGSSHFSEETRLWRARSGGCPGCCYCSGFVAKNDACHLFF